MYENEAEYISQQKTVDGEGELVEDMARYEWMDQTTLDPSSLCEVVLDTSNPLLELEEPLKSIDPVPEGGPEEHILSDIDDVKFPILDGCQSECKDATKEVTADTKCLKPESLSKLNLNRVPKVVLCRLEDENHNSWTDQMTVKSAFNQVPQNNNRRVLKVLLHRLEEDEQIKKHWKKTMKMLLSTSPQDKTSKYDLLKTIFTCDVCGKKFKSLQMFSDHREPTCVTLKSKLKQHIIDHPEFLCEVCGKIIRRKYRFEDHLKNHTNTMSFVCSICNKCFNVETYFRSHIRRVHSGKKPRPFTCAKCQKSFQEANHLKAHMFVCEGVTSFDLFCKTCGLKLNDQPNLRKHLQSHFSVDPHHLKIVAVACKKSNIVFKN